MPPVTKPKAPGTGARGWLVKAGQHYYTGNVRSALERWTVFPQFVKVYQRQRWAQTMAERFGGQVVPAPASRNEKAHSPCSPAVKPTWGLAADGVAITHLEGLSTTRRLR